MRPRYRATRCQPPGEVGEERRVSNDREKDREKGCVMNGHNDENPIIPDELVPRQLSDDPVAADAETARRGAGEERPSADLDADDAEGEDDDESIGLDELP
jgi:hypothetical protein